jgi:hypothetical protein
MADWEFDDVNCTAAEGTERDFYHWAIKLKKAPWTVRTDKFEDNKYLFFRWNQGSLDAFEVSMIIKPETGNYDVCNVVPLRSKQLTPREYNEGLDRFVAEILNQFNLDNGNSLHVEHKKCGGKLTYDYTPNLKDMWTNKDTENLRKTFIREGCRVRLEVMEDILNRHSHEIISMASHAEISHQIIETITQQFLRPGDCDLAMAAQCFVALCLSKMLKHAGADPSMFDMFLTPEYRGELSKLIGLNTNLLEGAIWIGAVKTDLDALYGDDTDDGVTQNA